MVVTFVERNCKISTHTLTWSVTESCPMKDACYNHFNSHAHVERDSIVAPFIERCEHFNSHAHVERDEVIESVDKQ